MRSAVLPIQGSDQTLVLSLSPITLPRCLTRRSVPRRIPFHPCDPLEDFVALRKEVE